jgi:Transposase
VFWLTYGLRPPGSPAEEVAQERFASLKVALPSSPSLPLIGVDPHKASNTLAVFDPVTRTPIDGARFANTQRGYELLLSFARRWGDRRWAVEGCHGAGRSLSQRLVGDGELVFDVPPRLAARVRVYSQGHGRKTDKDGSRPWTGRGSLRCAPTTPRSACAYSAIVERS